MKEKIILIGGGGHAKSCIDVLEQENEFEIIGILDIKERIGQKVLGYQIIGTDDDIKKFAKENYTFLITLGQLDSAKPRIEIYNKLIEANAKIATVISPFAYVSKHATIGRGTIIMHGSIVNADACIGENCIINTKSLIEHDAKVASHCHISTGAIINGGVNIGTESFIGSNSVSKQYSTIGKNNFIKAGSVIK